MATEAGGREAPFPSYGSISADSRSMLPGRGRRPQLVWLVGAVACAAAVAFTVLAVAWSGEDRSIRNVLLQKAQPSMLEGSDAVLAPTKEELASFTAGAHTVLGFVGINPADIDAKTDLRESCGDFMEPCIASVGACLMSESHQVDDRVEATRAACQCYVTGNTQPIDVPARPDVELRCSYTCLSAIKGMFQEHLHDVNGEIASSLACPRTFANLAHEAFANEFKYDVTPSEEDTDGLAMDSVVDEKVLRAVDAVQLHVNTIRAQECPANPELSGEPTVTYAQQGEVEAGRSQYIVEFMAADGQEFTARVVHLPVYKQVVDPTMEAQDPENLLGKFEVMRLSPDPCATGAAAVLAQTRGGVRGINAQKLHWKAQFDPHHEGATMDQFGMGLVWPSEAEIAADTVNLAEDTAAEAEELPASFDARDFVAGETQCRAFEVLNQGGCGSCYAFAAATALSARFCKESQGQWDIVLSPQEMMDCTRGCAGGWPLTIYKQISNGDGFSVENWCDPYTRKKQVCGDTCDDGQKFRGLKGTAAIVSGKGAKGVENMQRQLLKHGPGVVAVTVFKDFHSYKKGVYSKSEGAKKVGGHAVALIGWGTEDGVDYWLLQNSWGKRTGDKGFWKVRRGTNECGIESTGLMVVRPEMPMDCTETECHNGGSPDRKCQCQCPEPWEGEQCETCALQCHNGGKVLTQSMGLASVAGMVCSKCFCPEGTFGERCGTKVAISPERGTDKSKFTIEVSFQGERAPQGSFVALYTKDEKGAMAFVEGTRVFLCGESYDAAVDEGRCPASVSVEIKSPGRMGMMMKTYDVALVHYIPPNEFGLEGYPAELAAGDYVGEIQVMKRVSTAGGVQALASVARRGSVREQIHAAVLAATAKEDAMTQRLQAVDAIVEYTMRHGGHYGEVLPPSGTGEDAKPTDPPQLEPEKAGGGAGAGPAELPGSLTVSGSIGEHPVVWSSGAPTTVCYRLPAEFNWNPKQVFLYKGDGSELLYYPTGLLGGGANEAMPTSQVGCKGFAVSPGVPAGAIYTLKLQHESEVLAATPVLVAHAAVAFESYAKGSEDGQALLTLAVSWGVTAEAASAEDTVKLVDAQGAVVDWFFTSCSCKGPPGSEPVTHGEAQFTVFAPTDKPPGAYDLHFHPGGEEFVGAVADEWIPWTTAWAEGDAE